MAAVLFTFIFKSLSVSRRVVVGVVNDGIGGGGIFDEDHFEPMLKIIIKHNDNTIISNKRRIFIKANRLTNGGIINSLFDGQTSFLFSFFFKLLS